MAGRLDKTIKGIKSIDASEIGAATLAVGLIGASSALMSSVGRYTTSLGPIGTLSDRIGPDGRLALQSLGIIASGMVVTEMMLADVKGGALDMRKKKSRDLVQFGALGVASYRFLTGLSAGNIGAQVSGLFDGHLDALTTRRTGVLTNTPAEAAALVNTVNPVTTTFNQNGNEQIVLNMSPAMLNQLRSPYE